MYLEEELPWVEPLDMARGVGESEKCWILLYSGMNHNTTEGRYSVLGLLKNCEVKSDDFTDFASVLSEKNEKFHNAWFGYLGYGLKNFLEKLPCDQKSNIDLPNLLMMNFNLILLFDHTMLKISVFTSDRFNLLSIPHPIFRQKKNDINISKIRSNMTKREYLQKVGEIKECIFKGDLYQANLTRKFFGTFVDEIDSFAMFSDLCEKSPSPYSSFMRIDNTYIISSSPECFIKIDEKGYAYSRPIKGSAPRYLNITMDKESKAKLASSEKDKAENLMIVDLMRNDFSRSCESGSVSVEGLFDITSFSTVHHMSSTISGKKNSDVTTLDFVKNCFPAGSMTGAPKIKAMELCSQMENLERGVYSGAIGWFGGDGSADLSVVIRTLIIQNNDFEFQVGGAIIADSSPEGEWQETLLKAKAIAETLGITSKQLEVI